MESKKEGIRIRKRRERHNANRRQIAQIATRVTVAGESYRERPWLGVVGYVELIFSSISMCLIFSSSYHYRCATATSPPVLSTLQMPPRGCMFLRSWRVCPTSSWVCCSPSSSSSVLFGSLSFRSPPSGHGVSLSPRPLLKCTIYSPYAYP